MKRILLSVLLALSLAACGADGSSSGSSVPPASADAEEPEALSLEELPFAYAPEPIFPELLAADSLGINRGEILAELEAVAQACRPLLADSRVVRTLDGPEFILTDWEKQALLSVIGGMGYATADPGMDMSNPELVRSFYTAYEAGEDGQVGIYTFTGTLNRITFQMREGRLYGAQSGVRWDEDLSPIIPALDTVTEVPLFELSPKGILFYGSEEESTLHIRTVASLRISPLGEENRRICRDYIDPLVSYASNGVLSRDWDISSPERINLNDAFEFFYKQETGRSCEEDFTVPFQAGSFYPLAVPAEAFEPVMLRHFPLTREALRRATVYDPERQVYAVEPMAIPDASPPWEVVEVTHNDDGTLTVVVDGVSPENRLERAVTNTVIIRELGDGTCQYLSNRVTRLDGTLRSRVPAFQAYNPRVSTAE